RRRHHPQAQAARAAEGRQAADEDGRPGRGAAGGVHRRAADDAEERLTIAVTEPVRRFGADDLTEADPTPGMRREMAFEVPGLWAGLVHTEPGASSGWHHHGDHETSLYVVRGQLRLEF